LCYVSHKDQVEECVFLYIVMPPPLIGGGIKRSFIWRRLSDVCLSRTSGVNREQRGLGRLKLAQG